MTNLLVLAPVSPENTAAEPAALTPAQARLRKLVLDTVPSSPLQAQLREGPRRPLPILCQPASLPVLINGVAGGHGIFISLYY
jgi:hypothetical protein